VDAFVSQIFTAVVSWGPGGILALIAIGWGWTERKDKKSAEGKLETALREWKTDTEAQNDKLAAIIEKASALVEASNRRAAR